MPAEGTDSQHSANKLLAADEPPPYVVLNPDAESPVLLAWSSGVTP